MRFSYETSLPHPDLCGIPVIRDLGMYLDWGAAVKDTARPKNKLPRHIEQHLRSALRHLTDAGIMSNEIRRQLIDNPTLKLYLDTWVLHDLKSILEWSEHGRPTP